MPRGSSRVVARAGWSLVVDRFDPDAGRANEALLTIADGVIGTNGAPLFTHPAARPELMAAGVYDGEGPLTDLLAGPRWAHLRGSSWPADRVVRRARSPNRTARRAVTGATRVQSVRFSSLARPGVAVLRADVDPPGASDALAAPDGAVPTG